MAKLDLTSKFLGAMVGSALGDAIGELAFTVPSEDRLRATVDATDRLVYTDDTAMAIGLAESLTEIGDVDPQHLGRRFHDNYAREPWRGYAAGPPTLFAAVAREGGSYVETARRLYGGDGSLGNGAAMRVAPIGLAFHAAADIGDKARASAAVTHAHPIGMDGAAVLAAAVARAVALDPGAAFPRAAFCRRLAAAAETAEIGDRMAMVDRLVGGGEPATAAADSLGRSVAVHLSMPFAVYAFVAHPASFEECLFCAILNGGDRDTLGAMACAVSGAYLGIGAIPSAWRAKLENRDEIERLATALAAMAARGARGPGGRARDRVTP
ncbi:MAG: ADP-ribosylglycohydrolase family protein [Alphaproteobacteria bacterium]